ncbi:unnamed protein product [Ilex paraguariensis]|uniref:Uncharacterized protein n=1 Tax=Ilex paraguariensis TaxID=185542 RepID=A0ABC8U2S8_9AQUA
MVRNRDGQTIHAQAESRDGRIRAHGHCSRDAPAAGHGLCSLDAAPAAGLCSHDAAPALSHINTPHDLNTKHGEDKDNEARDISNNTSANFHTFHEWVNPLDNSSISQQEQSQIPSRGSTLNSLEDPNTAPLSFPSAGACLQPPTSSSAGRILESSSSLPPEVSTEPALPVSSPSSESPVLPHSSSPCSVDIVNSGISSPSSPHSIPGSPTAATPSGQLYVDLAPAAGHGHYSLDATPAAGLCSHDAALAALSHINTSHDLNTKHGKDKDNDARDISSDKDKD